MSRPLIVTPNGTSSTLKRVPLTAADSSVSYSEDTLQDLLYRHPHSLPIAEIDGSFCDPIRVCRELRTSQGGRIDVLYVTRSGKPVIVEAKLWRNPDARRTVVGQILDYAKDLSSWSYESLNAAVRAARRGEDGATPKGLVELVGIDAGSEEEAQFIDAVSRNLQRGDMLLLIVGDGIREGAGSITTWLEEHASLHFTFGLVEMAIYEMPGGGHLVQPRVLAQSQIVRRVVVDLRDGSMVATEKQVGDNDEEAASPEAETNNDLYTEFWSGVLAGLRLDDQGQTVNPPARSTNQFFPMPEGSQAWVSAYVAPSANRAGVYLTFTKGPIGDRMFDALQVDKVEIEDVLGVPVSWESTGPNKTKQWVSSAKDYSGVLLGAHRKELQQELADNVNRFVNVFRPRLEKLARETT